MLDPYFSAPKMAWIGASLTRDGVVTTTDTWLIHRLCGEFVTDISTASRSLLLDLDTTTWSGDHLALLGLADEQLPEIVACDQIFGETKAFGPNAITVAGLIVDQQACSADGQVYTAASAVRWAIDLGLVPAADHLDAVAQTASDSSAGVLRIPHWPGSLHRGGTPG